MQIISYIMCFASLYHYLHNCDSLAEGIKVTLLGSLELFNSIACLPGWNPKKLGAWKRNGGKKVVLKKKKKIKSSSIIFLPK